MLEKIIEPSTDSAILKNEVWSLFNIAVSARNTLGVTPSLQQATARSILDAGCESDFPAPDNSELDCAGCACEGDQSCDLCEKPDNLPCVQETLDICREMSPLSNIDGLLTTVKKYEYISLAENAYAEIGNKPFKLKATKEGLTSDDDIEAAASEFYQFLENFLEENQVRVTEIPEAFDFETLATLSDALSDSVQRDADNRLDEALKENEGVIERVFKRANFMREYSEVIKDTTEFPIGVMWLDDGVIKKEKKLVGGKLKTTRSIQCDAERIDPRYFWATNDWRLNRAGRAVFTLKKLSNGDLQRIVDLDTAGSPKMKGNIKSFLEDNEDGYKLHMAALFEDDYLTDLTDYDVLVSRGLYKAEGIIQAGVKIPDEYKDENYVPCEVWYAGGLVLKTKVLECTDETFGVYTTVFRRRGQSIFGYSLHDFIYPFAKMYKGAMEGINKSVGKATGSIIQIDTGVIDDPDKYLQKNDVTGEVTLDLSDDILVEFNSTNAFASPNFKGTPIHITQLPSDLNSLLPVIQFIDKELEKISGIPSILVSGSNISSALRTTDNFNAAFKSSAKVIKSLLRESEVRILEPAIQYFFNAKAASGDMDPFLLEAEPEILLSDTLTREVNEDRKLVQDIQELLQFSQLIPPEKLSALINNLGREVYNLSDDLIPGVEPLSVTSSAQPVAAI